MLTVWINSTDNEITEQTLLYLVGIVATDNDFFTVITKLCNSVTEYRYYICVALTLATAIILCCNFSLVFPA